MGASPEIRLWRLDTPHDHCQRWHGGSTPAVGPRRRPALGWQWCKYPPFWTTLRSGSGRTMIRADLGDLRASGQAPRRPVASEVVHPGYLARLTSSGRLGGRRQIRWPHGRLVAIGRHGAVPRRQKMSFLLNAAAEPRRARARCSMYPSRPPHSGQFRADLDRPAETPASHCRAPGASRCADAVIWGLPRGSGIYFYFAVLLDTDPHLAHRCELLTLVNGHQRAPVSQLRFVRRRCRRRRLLTSARSGVRAL